MKIEGHEIIKVKKLTKSYSRKQILHGLNFSIMKGEIFGLLGPNGAGKTTTIRVLTEMMKPTSGEIQFSPENIRDKIAIVSDSPFLYEEMTLHENMVLASKLYGLRKSLYQKRIGDLITLFDLTAFQNCKVGTLSLGLKKKTMIVISLINRPAILFLDEPTSSLDVHNTRQIRQIIKDLKNDGVTIFLTTHNLYEAEELCDRIGLLCAGKLIMLDSPANIKKLVQKEQMIEIHVNNPQQFMIKVKEDRVNQFIQKFNIEHANISLWITNQLEFLPEIFRFFVEHPEFIIKTFNSIPFSLEDAFLEIFTDNLKVSDIYE